MGLLDKLLGRGGTTAATEPAAKTAPTDSVAGLAGVEERDEDTSPHHHAEEDAGS